MTFISLNSGSHFEIGSESWSRPSSRSMSVAAATIGLVIEACRKIVSGVIGAFVSASR